MDLTAHRSALTRNLIGLATVAAVITATMAPHIWAEPASGRAVVYNPYSSAQIPGVYPFRANDSYYHPGIAYEERVLLETLQGIVNRQGALLYLDSVHDTRWVNVYEEEYGLGFVRLHQLEDVVRHFAYAVNGLVLYDELIDATRYVAITIGGVDDLLPVSRAIHRRYSSLFEELELQVVQDLSTRFNSSLETYRWALENVMPRVDKRYAHSVTGREADGVVTGYGPYGWFDWVVEHKGFVFNLSCSRLAQEEYGLVVGGSLEHVLMYKRILEELGPLVQIKGFGSPEWTWVELIAPYGYSFHWGNNLSFHFEYGKRLVRFDADGVMIRQGLETGNHYHDLSPFLFQAGGNFMSEDLTRITFADDPGVEAVEFMSSLFHVARISARDGGSFNKGLAAMNYAAQTAISPEYESQTGIPNEDVGVALPPKHKQQAQLLLPNSWAVINISSYPQQAWDWIAFASSVESCLGMGRATGVAPPRRSMLNYAPWNTDPRWKTTYEAMSLAVAAPIKFTHFDDLRKTFVQPALGKVLFEQEPIGTWKEAQRQAQAWLDDLRAK